MRIVAEPQVNDNKKLDLSANYPSFLKRQGFCNMKITLDGKPATITCPSYKFAVVVSADGKMKLEWTWEAVERIIANGGKFSS